MSADEPDLVAGLEIHQQLDTPTKLFCGCPTRLREPEDAVRVFHRFLHPTRSELGEIDAAALEEARVERRFEYLAYDSTCLVEEDDEPPGPLNEDAIETALQIADLLEMSPVDEAHVMRKIVVDGSNTSGFQRTVKLATDGAVETDHGTVRIDDLQLEEESAQRVEALEDGVRYSLDRLGIPLVEIGTAPDISSPEEARAVAEHLGMVLRSTRAVRRGLGTIRQDVNISTPDGARVELKGVQALDLIDEIVRLEVRRQAALLSIAGALRDRDAAVGDPVDVTDAVRGTDSEIVTSALEAGGRAVGLRLVGFDGLVGREIQPDRRLGSELADHARRHGVDGLFHTDELPGYGLEAADVEALRAAVGADPADAVALVVGDGETAAAALAAVAERAAAAIEGVPEETRDAREDGTSRYLRPLPGAARMYPETDVPPVDLGGFDVERPELLTDTVERYVEAYGLDPDLAEQVATGERAEIFEAAVEDLGVAPTVAATTLASTLTEMRRDGVDVGTLTDDRLREVFVLHAAGDVSKDGLPELLAAVARRPAASVAAVAEAEGFGGVDEDAVRDVVHGVVEANAAQVEAEGMGAFSALMGECMAELRGRADGELVSDLLREAIRARADGA
ncbi:MAG: Glu-tRNA(Gln) amidotransferase subunit GatE [Halobacteriales archaeon]